MKWFKHFSDCDSSESLTKLINDQGLEGYGRWWRLLEIIAKRMDKTGTCHAEYPENVWATLLKQKQKKLRTFLEYCQNVLKTKVEYSGNIIKIEIPKLLEIRDEFTSKSRHAPDIIPTDSGAKIQIQNKEKEKDLSARAREDLATPFRDSRPDSKPKEKIDWPRRKLDCFVANELNPDQRTHADLAFSKWAKEVSPGSSDSWKWDALRFACQQAREKTAAEIFEALKSRKFGGTNASNS